jgi:hypothetical protein|tara:strand:+ start:605 stop:745 length:141 start_codon:yes stop_codon:yes gene_type:complete
MIGYIITGVVCFVIGFIVAARNKDNINIGFGNTTTTQVYKDGKLQK